MCRSLQARAIGRGGQRSGAPGAVAVGFCELPKVVAQNQISVLSKSSVLLEWADPVLGSPSSQDQSHREFEASLSHMRSFLKKTKQNKQRSQEN